MGGPNEQPEVPYMKDLIYEEVALAQLVSFYMQIFDRMVYPVLV